MIQELLAAIVRKRLPSGVEITSMEMRDCYHRSTEISHWELAYSHPVSLPRRVVAKSCDSASGSIQREAEFYEKTGLLASGSYLPRFLGCSVHGESAMLVLEDVSEEFRPPVSGPSQTPSPEINQTVFCSLCAIHSEFWVSPEIKTFSVDMLSSRLGRLLEINQAVITRNLRLRPGMESALQLLTDLPSRLPSLLRSTLSREASLTIIHGDAHPGNFLVSDGKGQIQVMVIDWPNWQPGTPTDDLAYYLTLCFPPTERRVQEELLLRHYHQQLPVNIRQSYPWEQLLCDYRVSAMRCAAVALLWLAGESPQQWAWNSLEYVLDAWQQWECDAMAFS